MMTAKMRPTPYVTQTLLDIQRRDDGTLLLSNPHPLGPAFADMVAPLAHWAKEKPDHAWLVYADKGDWTPLSFSAGQAHVQKIARALKAKFPSAQTLAIISPNSLAHALLTYGALAAGMAVAAITPAYSFKAKNNARLKLALETVRADLVFAEDCPPHVYDWLADFGLPVLTANSDNAHGLPWLQLGPQLGGENLSAQAELPTIDPASPAKIMLTSGSTGAPKAVVLSHENLAINAAQIRSVFDAQKEADIWPDGMVMVNHLPWSHSLGGNAVFHMLLHAGGTLWIDQGSPTKEGISKTIAAIKQAKPNYHLTVPMGWALLADSLEHDKDLATAFFENLAIMQYGGAALTQDLAQRLDRLAQEYCGQSISFAAGYGATETAPTVCNVHWQNQIMGLVGLPVPGLSLKLVPNGERFEARVKGPAIFSHYLGAPDQTTQVFDEEGYYKLGDGLKFADPNNEKIGLAFAGRLSEAFKLANGSFVPVGPVRLGLLGKVDGLLSDLVLGGEGENYLVAVGFLNLERAKILVQNPRLTMAEATESPIILAALEKALCTHNKSASATQKIMALGLEIEPPQLELGEITDKGYLNQALCRQTRQEMIAALVARRPMKTGIFLEN